MLSRAPAALFITAIVLSTGGCCRCWWPGASSKASPVATAGEGDEDGGDDESAAPPGSKPGHKGGGAATELSTSVFAPDPRTPLRGALMRPPADYDYPPLSRNRAGSGLRFVPHSAVSAAPAAGGDLVVEANTGIWVHDPTTFARKTRLVAPPVAAMAASPDGRYIAYVRGESADLQIITYPDAKPFASIHGIDAPRRIRFSPDGKRVVISSRRAETVVLADIASRSLRRYDTDDDVNDAIALPDSDDLVAYANDGDEAVIYSMGKHEKIFTTAPSMREWKGVALDPLRRPKEHIFSFLRDQNAVAFDPIGGVFYAGGDDNVVWRFHGATGKSPVMAAPVELGGNVEEILCTHKPAPGQTEASAVVSLDTLAVHVLTPDGKVQASLGPLEWSITSSPIRIALTPEDDVFAVLDGALARFRPSDGSVSTSTEYPRFLFGWEFSPTDTETVIAAGDRPVVIHYIAHTAEAADVATTIIGTADISGAWLDAFASGTRLLAGASPGGELRLIYFVPASKALEAPVDVAGSGAPAQVVKRKDGSVIGILDAAGRLFEATETPRGAKLIGHVGHAPAPGEQLAWDDRSRKWQIAGLDGHALPIDSTPP